jgi:hypothetical protein
MQKYLERPVWVLACDFPGCGAITPASVTRPDLKAAVASGWFIAALSGDRCPPCVGLGRHAGINPHAVMTVEP